MSKREPEEITCAMRAAAWLLAHPGWHGSVEIAEAIHFTHPRNIAGILHQIPNIEHTPFWPLTQYQWRLCE
jgi:hypothetical protein